MTTPSDIAALLQQALTALAALPAALDEPLLVGPEQVGRMLSIPKRAAAFQMRAGLFGSVVHIGREPRVRLSGVRAWLNQHEGKEDGSDEPSGNGPAAADHRRGGRAGGGVRGAGRVDSEGRNDPSRIVAIAPRGARAASGK